MLSALFEEVNKQLDLNHDLVLSKLLLKQQAIKTKSIADLSIICSHLEAYRLALVDSYRYSRCGCDPCFFIQKRCNYNITSYSEFLEAFDAYSKEIAQANFDYYLTLSKTNEFAFEFLEIHKSKEQKYIELILLESKDPNYNQLLHD
jgi:hypothetical protein